MQLRALSSPVLCCYVQLVHLHAGYCRTYEADRCYSLYHDFTESTLRCCSCI